MLMGAPTPRRGLGRLNDSLLTRLLRGLPGVDIRIVADPTLRRQGHEEKPPAAAAWVECGIPKKARACTSR